MRQRPRGFTLVELIVVLTLLAVVAALAAPRLAGFMAGRNVDEECRRFVALTQYARDLAVSRGEPVEMTLDAEGVVYGLRLAIATGLPEPPKSVLPEFESQKDLWFESDGETPNADGGATIVFLPDGSIGEESPVEFRLIEAERPVYAISLDANRLQYSARRYDDAIR